MRFERSERDLDGRIPLDQHQARRPRTGGGSVTKTPAPREPVARLDGSPKHAVHAGRQPDLHFKARPRRGLQTMLANRTCMAKRGAAALLMLLLCSLTVASGSASTTEIAREEAWYSVHGEAGSSWSTTLDLDVDQRGLFAVTCTSCEARVTDDAGSTVASAVGGLHLIHVAEASSTFNLAVDFVVEEQARAMTLASTLVDLEQRPPPGASVEAAVLSLSTAGDLWWVDADHVRLDAGWEGAETAVLNVSDDAAGYLLANATGNAWVDVAVQHASSEINLRLIVQNATTEATHSTHTLDEDDLPFSHRLMLGEDERLLALVEGTAPNTGVAMAMAAHPTMGAMHHDLNNNEGYVVGHGGQIMVLDVNDTDALHLEPAAETDVLVQHLVQGTWVSTSSASVTNATVVWPLPGAEALRLTCSSPACFATLRHTMASDLASGKDAPGYVDITDQALLDGELIGHLPLNGSANGHLIRATHDVADVFPLHIDAWEDSIHLVKVTLWTDEPVRVELFPINPLTGELDDDELKDEILNGQGDSISAQFGRGTHLIRISLLDQDAVLNTTWGQDLPVLNYTVEMAHGVVDEGDEPWFEPDEASQIWGERVRWFLGFCFLLPVAYLARMQRRRTRLANTMKAQRERLRRIVQRLDEGRPVEQERRDLNLALDAVATLDFEDACRSWGNPDLRHRTDELAMAAWRLDPRLARQGKHVVLVGLAAGPRTWEATALRFDAPIGASCSVCAVEPRFMHHGEDVFLDTIRAGSVVFLTVELDGEATMVDVEVNGLVEAEPRAARAPVSLLLEDLEEA